MTTNVIKLLGCLTVTSVPTGIRSTCKSDLAMLIFIFRSVYLVVPYTCIVFIEPMSEMRMI